MKTKQILALVIAVALFIITGVSSVMTHTASKQILDGAAEKVLSGDLTFSPPSGSYIGVVNIVGTIQEQAASSLYEEQSYKHTTTMEYIDELMDDPGNKGLLLYVDSPGGTVYESQEMYDKLMEYKAVTKRPIYAYMAHYGASGAYMISMAADTIYANQNTTTGSIGVIMSGYDMSGLYEKLGIKNINITSGKNKATEFNKEQMEIYQSQVDEYFNEFVNIVSEGRDMTKKQVRKLADGRTYTAKQAMKNGLIDEVASLENAKADISAELGVTKYYQPKSITNWWTSFLGKVEDMMPKSDTQVLKETAENLESGVFMYYAEL